VWLFALAFGCGTAHGELAQYPFRVIEEPLYDGRRVVAVNDGEAPVSVAIAFEGENLGIDGALKQRFVLAARTKRVVARLYAFDPRQPYRAQTRVQHRVGDERAQPDGALLRLPFPDGQEATVGRSSRHEAAVVFALPHGTPVLAARDGRVIDVDAEAVIVFHADGSYARYHGLAPNPLLRAGQTLAVGAPVGTSESRPVEFAMQATRGGAGGPTAEALPATFFAYAPPVALRLVPGQSVLADYAHPYVAPANAEPDQTLEPEVRPEPLAADPDRATVQRAFAAQFGAEAKARSAQQADASPAWRRSLREATARTSAAWSRLFEWIDTVPGNRSPWVPAATGLVASAIGLGLLWLWNRRAQRRLAS
jgi:hypothetical protein